MNDAFLSEVLGYVACSAVLATFLMRSMVPLRLIAILSNILFLSYGYLEHIHPVFFLHAALLPVNIIGLAAFRRGAVPNQPDHHKILSAAVRNVRHASIAGRFGKFISTTQITTDALNENI